MKLSPEIKQDDISKFFSQLYDIASGRKNYSDLRSFAEKAVNAGASNPVYDEVRSVLIYPSLSIIVGARGSGKTTLLALASYDLEANGYNVIYVTPNYRQIECAKLQHSGKMALLLDDFAEYDDALLNNLRICFEKLEENPSGYKIIIATQSEKNPVASIGKIVDLLNRPWMFFGSRSAEEIKDNLTNYIATLLYVSGKSFERLRAASVVSLDAFWARYRSFGTLSSLIDLLRRMTAFYAYGIFGKSETAKKLTDEAASLFDAVAVALLARPPVIRSEASYVFILETADEATLMEDMTAYELNGRGVVLALANAFESAFSDTVERRKWLEEYKRVAEKIKELEEIQVSSRELVNAILEALKYYKQIRRLPIVDVSENYPVEKICGPLKANAETQKKRRRGPESGVIIVQGQSGTRYYVMLQHAGETSDGRLSGYQCKRLEILSKCANIVDRKLLFIVSMNSQLNIAKCTDINKLESGVEILYADSLQKSKEGGLARELGNIQDEGLRKILAVLFLNSVLLKIRDRYRIPKLAIAVLEGRVV
jgi:KaiC/GvpD/RAD55 family RecA-like ATPase